MRSVWPRNRKVFFLQLCIKHFVYQKVNYDQEGEVLPFFPKILYEKSCLGFCPSLAPIPYPIRKQKCFKSSSYFFCISVKNFAYANNMQKWGYAKKMQICKICKFKYVLLCLFLNDLSFGEIRSWLSLSAEDMHLHIIRCLLIKY